jgi:glycosyltransferase involved in cell wall biosynthesis
VREVITDGDNGLLVDFFSPKQIASRVDEVFNRPTRMAEIRKKARETAIERYAMPTLLKRHIQLIEDVASGVLNNKSFTV